MTTELQNILQISLACLFFMTSFITIGNAQRYLLNSIEEENPHYNGNAYISFCIHFGVFAISNLFAPSISSLLGVRVTMFISSICQLFYNIQFLFPNGWLLYTSSAIRGFGAGILWTAQGRYFTQNSSKETITRNAGIFAGILWFNRLIGNIYIFFRYTNDKISKNERVELYGIMVGTCSLSCILFATLKKAVDYNHVDTNFIENLYATWKLLWTRDMLLLIPIFIYYGIHLSFSALIYSNALGFTHALDWPDMQLISLSGILIGVGGITGGLFFSIFGKKLVRFKHYPFVIIGTCVHIISYILIILNLPDSSPNGETDEPAIIKSTMPLAFFSSFFIGLGSSAFDTQLYAVLGLTFISDISQAHAIFRMVQGLASGTLFFVSNLTGLYVIIGVLILSALFGTLSFSIMDLKPNITNGISEQDFEK